MKDFLKFFDKFTFAILLLMAGSGIFIIYSASHAMNESHFSKQLLWLAFSIIAFFVLFKIRTELVFNFSLFVYAVLLAVLLIQIVAGQIVAGTKSWIKMGFFYIQISEFIKIPLALLLAKTLTKMSVIQWNDFYKLLAIIGAPFILIALQPDMGTAFMLTSFLVFAVILKKIKPIIVVFVLLVLVAGSFAVWNYMLKPYQKGRITSFMNPEKYKQSTGYQIIQSKIALGSGGLQGKGYLNGTQSQYKFLPTRHTDFIISVLGEEFGFLGISCLFFLFFIFFYRQFNSKTQSDEEYYYIVLFNGIILFQFMISVMMTIGFFPVMGIPLPFVSYGGSSLLAFFTGQGIIFRIKINSYLSDY
ncbi:MAG: rod shape-determining protein RodA [bacterium]|nr:rod shape-determining protein RodA [bacterium]